MVESSGNHSKFDWNDVVYGEKKFQTTDPTPEFDCLVICNHGKYSLAVQIS